ncbi:response regulator transcription factor [Candidatus Chloroploca sp. Khr17]|uniref:response regulator transcription factor n=1 Tax=Candidatus Chloroploca sp. Khr17 TaxID=2496869 RepID=UPI00101C8198|nr:response regulator transcription factor [Candidatus Chloroploca sp. Khr17]
MDTTSLTVVGQVCIVSGVDETTRWLTELLSNQGHAVSAVADLGMLAETLTATPDVLVIDARADLPQARGILAMAESRSVLECVPILLLDEEPAAALIKLIAVASGDYLVGPLYSEAIVARVDLALRRGAYQRATQQASSSSPQPSEAPAHAGAHRQASVPAALFQRAIEYLPIGVMIASPMNQIGSRVWVEDQLARYTRYQQALANASLTMLTAAPDAATRSTALRQALQQLLDGAIGVVGVLWGRLCRCRPQFTDLRPPTTPGCPFGNHHCEAEVSRQATQQIEFLGGVACSCAHRVPYVGCEPTSSRQLCACSKVSGCLPMYAHRSADLLVCNLSFLPAPPSTNADNE